ncbi:hypothetical protein F5Y18DRAFT_430758 [Xylariaceae sp. FL1019]|nr:hypothetical protein F5Y18DRAFT_430758 [Xylariaceae sp. FL1019]
MEFLPLLDDSTERTCQDGLKKDLNTAFQDGFKEGFKSGCEAQGSLNAQLRDEVMSLKQDIQILRQGLAKSTKAIQKLQQNLSDTEDTVQGHYEEHEDDLQKLEEDHGNATKMIQELRKDFKSAEEMIWKRFEDGKKATIQAIEQLQAEYATTESVHKLEQQLADSNTKRRNLHKDQDATTGRVRKLEQQLADSDAKRRELRQDQDKTSKIVEVLRNEITFADDNIRYLEAHFLRSLFPYTLFRNFVQKPYAANTTYSDGTPLDHRDQWLENTKAGLSIKYGHGVLKSIEDGK